MTSDKPHILIIEDDAGLLNAYISHLESADYAIDGTHDMAEAHDMVRANEYAVILTDLKLHTADEGGLEILREVKKTRPDTQVIIFSGVGDTQTVMQAFRLSANEYLTKPLNFDQVRAKIKSHIDVHLWQKSLRGATPQADLRPDARPEIVTPEPFYYYADTMKNLVRRVTRLYRTSENILITGEPGTGKSLLAEGIHRGSGRTHFELVNCAGLSDITLEPLLFGSTSADGYQPGLLARLQGGTLVLDRVTGMGKQLQSRLAEALAAGEFVPASGMDRVKIDLRIISIDEDYLLDDVEQNLFLPELFQVLKGAHLRVPPLRARYDASYRDAIILAQQFITYKYGAANQLDPETEYMIEQYPFPGNVAELDRIVRRALGSVVDGAPILPEHLPKRMLRYGVRPGLGTVGTDQRVLCPHGPFHCDRTGVIATAHQSLNGVYLRLHDDFPFVLTPRLDETLRELGLSPLYSEDIPDALTSMCRTCVPVQSGHYAVIDVTDADGETLYDVGLLHALGTPTLIVSREGAAQTTRLHNEQITYYSDHDHLLPLVNDWLHDVLL